MRTSVFLAAIVLIFTSACTDRERSIADKQEPVELRVMTFNIEWGGTNISFDNVVEAIRLSGADIVGIQEAEGNLSRIAAELGWHYDLQNYAISRFPILDAPNSDRQFVLVEVSPGQVVALANVHLPSDPSGTEFIRDGGLPGEVIKLEKTVRLESLRPFLKVLEPVVAQDMPVFLTGDFNAPSHADWTEAMVDARPFLKYPVDWPVSRAIESAGFNDSWRIVHPDPETHPGLTWWAGRPPLENYAPGENDPQDRIDFVWFAGAAKVLSSELVGEAGAQNVTLSVSPWPSDHRAVVSTFSVEPATVPRLVSASRRIFDQGDDVIIIYRNAAGSEIEVAGRNSPAKTANGELRFPAGTFSPGHYEVALHTPGNRTIGSDFWVVDRPATPTVSVSRDTYNSGDAIEISWKNGPGHRNDYLGIYGVGIESTYTPGYDGGLTWLYVDALPEGSIILDQTTSVVVWPLPPGNYVARLMKDDGYDTLAESTPFVVQ